MKNKDGKQELEKRINDWKVKGKKESEITWGMINDDFKSLSGIPDDFYSAEDSEDRIKLWNQYKPAPTKKGCCGGGDCFLCDPTYKD